MTSIASSWEIELLAWSVVLLLAQIVLQAQTATRELGVDYSVGPRDAGLTPKGVVAARARRALSNLLETYPGFIALALALAVSGKTGGTGALGAQIWFGARLIYVPAYLAGALYFRSAIWGVSLVGLALMLVRLLG